MQANNHKSRHYRYNTAADDDDDSDDDIRSYDDYMAIFIVTYVEIKCQLEATDDFYCRSHCLLNTFRAPICPSSGAREYYIGGCCLWYLVLWFSSCRYGVPNCIIPT